MKITSCKELGDMTYPRDIYSSSPAAEQVSRSLGALDAFVPGCGPPSCAPGVFDQYPACQTQVEWCVGLPITILRLWGVSRVGKCTSLSEG
jgi:hypothetical protein